MKKITTFLLASTCALTFINSFSMLVQKSLTRKIAAHKKIGFHTSKPAHDWLTDNEHIKQNNDLLHQMFKQIKEKNALLHQINNQNKENNALLRTIVKQNEAIIKQNHMIYKGDNTNQLHETRLINLYKKYDLNIPDEFLRDCLY